MNAIAKEIEAMPAIVQRVDFSCFLMEKRTAQPPSKTVKQRWVDAALLPAHKYFQGLEHWGKRSALEDEAIYI